MQDIVEKLIVLTEIEDSIVEGDAFYEEDRNTMQQPGIIDEVHSIQVELTNPTVTEEVTHEDMQSTQELDNSKEEVVVSPVTSQVDLKSSTVEAWN